MTGGIDPPDPDAALMLAFQKGDEGSFERLLDKYQRPIVNFIYKIVNNRAEAEELAQDVFLRIYRARHQYEPRARFSAWIYRIATNTSLKALRQRRIVQSLPQESQPEWQMRDRQPDAERRLVAAERDAMVRTAIGRLPEKQRIAIVLRRYEGLSYKEIADVMRCTEAAVKTYIHRGKLGVRDHLLAHSRKGKI